MNSRAKGLTAEREVAKIWAAHGLEVRNLEGVGDHLVIVPGGMILHSEVKRQERFKLAEWLLQAGKEAPGRAIPVVSFRKNGGRWFAALPLDDLAELVAR